MGLYERFVKALANMPEQLKQVEGYGYRYTPLPNIINAVRPILAKHGLGLYQEVESANNEVVVRTILFDEEGNKLVSPDLVLPVIKSTKTKEGKDKLNVAQCIGATITYARRYSLSAFLGIATEEDTDAHSNGSAITSPAPKKASNGDAPTQKQVRYLHQIGTKSLIEKGLRAMGKESVKDLTQQEMSVLIKMVQGNFPECPDSILWVFNDIIGKTDKEAQESWKIYFKKYDDVAKAELELLKAVATKVKEEDKKLAIEQLIEQKGGKDEK